MTMKTPTSVQLSYRCCRFLKVMKNISNASIPFIQILGFIIWLSFYCLHVLFFDAWYWPAFIIFTWLHFCWVLVGVLLSNYYSEVSRRLYIVSQYFVFSSNECGLIQYHRSFLCTSEICFLYIFYFCFLMDKNVCTIYFDCFVFLFNWFAIILCDFFFSF